MSYDDEPTSFGDKLLDGWHGLGPTTQTIILLSAISAVFVGGVFVLAAHLDR